MNAGISVFIPAYNAGNFIKHTIESVLRQQYREWELIIVDDCSTDETHVIATKYALEDKRISVCKNEQNLGMMPNWNKGISLCSGKYFMKLDADDLIHPEFLQRCFDIMEADDEIGLVCARHINIDFDGKIIPGSESQPPDFVLDQKFDYGSFVRQGISLFSHDVCRQGIGLIRKSIIDRVGGFLTIQPADSEYWFRIAAHCYFFCIGEIMHYHRVWAGSDTRATIVNNWGRFETNIYNARNAIFEYYYAQKKISLRQFTDFSQANQHEYNKFLFSYHRKNGSYIKALMALISQISHKPIETIQYYLNKR